MQTSKSNEFCFYLFGAIIIGILIFIGSIIYIRSLSGDFVLSLEPTPSSFPGIEVSDTIGFESPTSHLSVDSIVDKLGFTYASINFNEIIQSDGQYLDPNKKYLAYSFYIKNVGTTTVSIDYSMSITNTINHLDQYVRILVIEDDTDYIMYQKSDQPDLDNNMPQYNQLPLGISFESENIVFRDRFDDFEAGAVKSFRIIIWLEEQDLDIHDDYQSGNFETQLTFSISHPENLNTTKPHISLSDSENLWFTLQTSCNIDFRIYYYYVNYIE